jgi:Concanavalin A-like lectin/glucanases superfamily
MATVLWLAKIDSPSSGTVSTISDSSTGTAVNLTCTSVTGTSIASGVGASFGSSSGAVSGSLSGTKIATALAGATKCTLEGEFDTTSDAGFMDMLGLQATSFDDFCSMFTGSAGASRVAIAAAAGIVYYTVTPGRHRFMAVIDTTQATNTNRFTLYVDGTAATVDSGVTPSWPVQNTAIDSGFTNWANNRLAIGCLISAGVQSFQGPVYIAALYSSALTSTDASGHNTAISSNNDADPNSSGLTLALTGVSSTAAVGTVGPSLSKALTGNASTAAVGTIAPARSVPVTGNASTAAVGTVTPSRSVALTGNAATGAVGTVTVSGSNITLALTGVAATGAVGTVGPGLSAGLIGNAATGSPGSVGLSASIAIAGVPATGSVGAVAPATSKALTGNSSTAAVGTVGPSRSVPLTGNAATGAVGNVGTSGGTPTAAVAVSRWKVDETSGTTLADSIGSNTLTLNAGYTLNVTPPAVLTSSTGAIRGTTACIAARGSATGLPNGSASQSWSLWIKATSNAAAQAIFSLTNSTLTAGAGLFLSAGSLLMLEYNGSSTLVSATAPSTGSWHHVAWTYDGSTNANLLYVDGTQVGSATAAATTSTTADVLLTSSDSGTTNPFDGDIDDVRIFSGVLTAAQITRMAAGGEPNDTTLALTGVSSTATVGTVGPARSVALTGNASTSAIGSVGLSMSLALTGAAASGAAGTVGPGSSVGVTGVSGTGSVGSVGPGRSVPLTGAVATAAVGTISVNGNLTIALTGVAATAAVGAIAAARAVALAGVTAAGSVGTLGVNLARALTGVRATGAVGNTAPPIPIVQLYPPFVAFIDSQKMTAAVDSQQLTAETAGDTLSVTADT